jgi:hypothetical protein
MLQDDNPHSASSFITPLTDISANIFAMMIFILILAPLSQKNSHDVSTKADEDFNTIERSAMTAPELVQHLYDRRADSGVVRIDLQQTECVVIASDGKEQKLDGSAVETALAKQLAGASSVPIRLYVFSHERYDSVVRSLRSANLSWQEISVPQALRSAEQTAWSSEFTDLLMHTFDKETFRVSLARLLASKDPRSKLNDAGQDNSPPRSARGQSLSEPLLERLMRWWRHAIGASALFAAFVFIVWLERRTATAQLARKRPA